MDYEILPFACIDCGSRNESKGKCGRCGADGTMDLRDPAVRTELINEDDQRRNKRRYQMIWAAVPVGALIFFVLGMGIVAVVAGGAGGYGLSLLLAKIFPAKQLFPYARP